jgi:hypothetical protein
MRNAFVVFACLIAAACAATDPSPRPLVSGFPASTGVVDPYGDGRQHLAAGRHKLAIERFGQALANDRRSLDALNGLGVAYTRLGRFGIAQTYFERALQVDATSALTLNNYGWSLAQQGRLRDAKPFLELALDYAAEVDAPVIAQNIESIGRTTRSAPLKALGGGGRAGAHSGHRLIRVGANLYRLETVASPTDRPDLASVAHDPPQRRHSEVVVSPEPQRLRADRNPDSFVVAKDVDVAGSTQAPADHVRAAEPDSEMLVDTQPGDKPLEPRAGPVPGAEAITIQVGKKT